MPHYRPMVPGGRRYLLLPIPRLRLRGPMRYFLLGLLILGSNLLTHWIWNGGGKLPFADSWKQASALSTVYLAEKTSHSVDDPAAFAHKVAEIAEELHIPNAWLMAVMYRESKFNPQAEKHAGSGAIGLIPFTPNTARELGVSGHQLRQMSALQQLDYVYHYFQQARERGGDFDSLTDLYLAVLYPRARGQDYCYTLFSKPSQAYRRNGDLDEDRDGRVSISDIDRQLKRMFPEAYQLAPGME